MQQVARKFFINQLKLSLSISPATDSLSFFMFSHIFYAFLFTFHVIFDWSKKIQNSCQQQA